MPFVGKLLNHTDIFINQRIEFYLNSTVNLRPLTSHNYAMLYPQNGGRIVAIDSVTSFHRIYRTGEGILTRQLAVSFLALQQRPRFGSIAIRCQ